MACDPVVLNCDTCYKLTLAIADMNVEAGLTPASAPYLWITDKFGKRYSDRVTVNGDGSFDVVVSHFPEGLLRQSGSFDSFLSSDVDGEDVVPMVFDEVSYDCLIFNIDYSGDCPTPEPPDECAIFAGEINALPEDLRACILDAVCDGAGGEAFVRNSNDTYNQTIICGDTLTLQDITYSVYVNTVFQGSSVLPAAVNNTINIL